MDTSEVPNQANVQHRTDSITILVLLGLLLVTILTVWLFKHRRLRFVHESGLSMFYGLIVGAIVRYGSKAIKYLPSSEAITVDNHSYYFDNAPQILYVNYSVRNSTEYQLRQYDVTDIIPATILDVTEPLLEKMMTFDPEIFFNVMLPVIIFEAGYSMKQRHFFSNIGAILTYAIIGTTVSSFSFGLVLYGCTQFMSDVTFTLVDCFYFGAIISATDPVTIMSIFNDLRVDVNLHALVFGESVLNDAVAIVLSQSVALYGEVSVNVFETSALFSCIGRFLGVFTGSFAIGSAFGITTAFLTKFTKVREFPLLESALFFLMSYCSFQASEAADLTGIVAVLFCGMTQAHYTYNNLSPDSKIRTKKLFELANFLAENFVFLYVGVSIFTLQPVQWHFGFILSSFLAIFIGRLLNIYPLTFFLNLVRSNRICCRFQHMMMFSGLRGAVSFALAIRNLDIASHQHMASATMMIVLSTVIFLGGFTAPMLQWLQIDVGVEPENLPSIEFYNDQHAVGEGGIGQQAVPVSRANQSRLSSVWHNFDGSVLKPLLTNCRPTLFDTLPKCCLPLAKLFTTEEQLNEGYVKETFENDSDMDMIVDASHAATGHSLPSGFPVQHSDPPIVDTVNTEVFQGSRFYHFPSVLTPVFERMSTDGG